MVLAERGIAMPMITVFTSSWIFAGQLTSTQWFLTTSRKHRLEQLGKLPEFEYFRGSPSEKLQALNQAADSVTGLLNAQGRQIAAR
jgi:hypothetical protein